MKARGEDVSLVLCGEAGQGIQTVEDLLTKTLKRSGFHVCAVKEYMSRIRGGHNSITIRVGSRRVAAPVNRIDVLVPLSRGAVAHVAERLDAESIVLADLDALDDIETPGGASLIDVPFCGWQERRETPYTPIPLRPLSSHASSAATPGCSRNSSASVSNLRARKS